MPPDWLLCSTPVRRQRRSPLPVTCLALVLAGALFAGCGIDQGVTATRSQVSPDDQPVTTGDEPPATDDQPTGDTLIPDDTTVDEPPDDYEVIPGIIDFGDEHEAKDYDALLTTAIADMNQFWESAYPELYDDAWQPLEGGIYAAYPDRADGEIPDCGGEESTYRTVRDRGAFYCSFGDFIAYDDADLLPGLDEKLGPEAVAIVIAHELGHAVQQRSDNMAREQVILLEQQADCFAGAWAARVTNGESDTIRFDDADVRAGLIAMIEFRDPVEAGGLNNAEAHGTGFDRVGAFQDGFAGGAQRCKSFFDEDRLGQLIDIPFDPTDPRGGNLPLVDSSGDGSDIVTLLPQSLDFFWEAIAQQQDIDFTPPTFSPFPGDGPYPECDGIDESAYNGHALYCAEDNTIYWDEDTAAQLAGDETTGDLSVGYLFAYAYAEAIRQAAGNEDEGEERGLTDDCLSGAYIGGVVPPVPADAPISLSAGDLDEAIVTVISRSDPSSDTNVVGSAFERVAAFREGVLGGLAVCGLG